MKVLFFCTVLILAGCDTPVIPGEAIDLGVSACAKKAGIKSAKVTSPRNVIFVCKDGAAYTVFSQNAQNGWRVVR